MIGKKAISVTLHRDNVTWLKGRADAAGCKSVSELLDRLVTAARAGGHVAPPRSVVGTIEIDSSDPSLEHADAEVRRMFEVLIGRPGRGKSRRSQSREKNPRGA
jgi:hypothetical protein